MDVELAEIADFFATCPPFDILGREEIAAVVPTLTMRYHRRGDTLVAPGEANQQLRIVRSGAVEVCEPGGALLDTRDVGDSVGYSTLVSRGPSRYLIRAVADTLVLQLPGSVLDELCERHPEIRTYFGRLTDRVRQDLVAARLEASGGDALETRVAELLTRDAVTANPETSIRAAAEIMTRRRVSSLLIVDGEQVVGVLSDRDLRSRVLAAGLDPALPVRVVMSCNPVTVQADTRVFDATLLMMQRSVHHLPVVSPDGPMGVITSTDVLRLAGADPVYLSARIDRAPDGAAISEQMSKLKGMVVEFVRRGNSAADTGHVIAASADAAIRRYLQLAEDELGPAPLPHCWLVLGSHARGELGVASDQDSALVLAREPSAEEDAWFAAAAKRVREGMLAAGFPLCPGEVMAANPKWRLSLEQWVDRINTWVLQPESENVLDAQVAFDLRPVAGERTLAERVQKTMALAVQESNRFQAYLARDAASWQPPLGFFRGLIVERRGEYRNTLDIKAGGIAPIVQIARLHALAVGRVEVETTERLRAAAQEDRMTSGDAQDLIEAFAFLRSLQVRHHADCISAGAPPDNRLEPNSLSTRERHRLRSAFRIISQHQQALGMRYPLRQM